MVPRNLRPTNNLECFASPACMFYGFFPARLGSWESTYPIVSIGLETKKDTIFCSLPCYSCSPPGFLGGFPCGWYVQVSMYAPNKTFPGSAWRGRPQSRSRLHLSPSLLAALFCFSDFLPRARSRSHLTPKGEYIRYCYLLRDTSARKYMYVREKGGASGFPLNWT